MANRVSPGSTAWMIGVGVGIGVGGGSVAAGMGVEKGGEVGLSKTITSRGAVAVGGGGDGSWVMTCPQALSVRKSVKSEIQCFACIFDESGTWRMQLRTESNYITFGVLGFRPRLPVGQQDCQRAGITVEYHPWIQVCRIRFYANLRVSM